MLALVLTFDPAVDITGLATVALAIVTLALVVVGWRALGQTKKSLDQTADELGLSREEVRQSHRPLLVCAVAEFDAHRVEETEYQTTGIALRLKNIGVGPAVDVVAQVQMRGDDGRLSMGGGSNWWTGLRMGIGADSYEDVFVAIDRLSGLPCFAFRLTYADVAGERWYTSGIYLLPRATGSAAAVVQPEVGRVPSDDAPLPVPAMPKAPAALDQ